MGYDNDVIMLLETYSLSFFYLPSDLQHSCLAVRVLSTNHGSGLALGCLIINLATGSEMIWKADLNRELSSCVSANSTWTRNWTKAATELTSSERVKSLEALSMSTRFIGNTGETPLNNTGLWSKTSLSPFSVLKSLKP